MWKCDGTYFKTSTTASTFPFSSKNSSAEHIHALSTWFIITYTLTHLHTYSTTGKMLLSEHKKGNRICLKQKHWSKRWVLGTSNRCPDHLSRQFRAPPSTFTYSSKNPSAEHIHALSTWLIITNTLTHSHRQTHTLTHSLT